MGALEVFLYSLIQSLCEFFPISSSAHLALLPFYLKIRDPGVEFDLILHVGSVLAVIFYFRVKISEIVTSFIEALRAKKVDEIIKTDFFLLGISTFFSLIFIYIFKDISENWGRLPIIIASNLISFGFLLYLVDLLAKKNDSRDSNDMTFSDVVLIGFSQSLAIFPGVSRSGICMTCMRYLGYSREKSGEFSFLLAIPIIVIGFLYKVIKLSSSSAQINFSIESSIIGVVLTFVLSLLVIRIFFKILKNVNFFWFALYRLIIGIAIFSHLF